MITTRKYIYPFIVDELDIEGDEPRIKIIADEVVRLERFDTYQMDVEHLDALIAALNEARRLVSGETRS